MPFGCENVHFLLSAYLNTACALLILCRILNRFTKDMHFMDDLLPLTVYDFIICAFMVFGGVLIVFIVNPWVVLRCGENDKGSLSLTW